MRRFLGAVLVLQSIGWAVACLGFGYCPIWSALLAGGGLPFGLFLFFAGPLLINDHDV